MFLSRPSVLALSFTVLLGGIAVVGNVWFSAAAEVAKLPTNPSLPVASCSVAPLGELTDQTARTFETGEGLAVDVSGLTPHTVQALSRFEDKIISLGGKFTVTSAFRPASYQQHLRDVWMKWMNELKDNQEPGCADLRASVQREFQRHALLESQHPVEVSDHTKGTGFDAAISLPVQYLKVKRGKRKSSVGLDQLAKMFGLRRPNPSGDRVHFRCAS